jgi:DNA-binding NarL/FixJ family response regulator
MQPPNAIIALGDRVLAQILCDSLEQHFNFIYLAATFDQARSAIPRYRPLVIIVDVELAPLSEIELLRRQYRGMNVVCTHRLADDSLWTDALNAGASDVCQSSDVAGIMRAALCGHAARGNAA